MKSWSFIISSDFIKPFSVILIQSVSILILLYLLMRRRENSEEVLWLILYFGGSLFLGMVSFQEGELRWLFQNVPFVFMSMALLGLGEYHFDTTRKSKENVNRLIISIIGTGLAMAQMVALILNKNNLTFFSNLDEVALVSSFIWFSILSARYFLWENNNKKLGRSQLLLIASLGSQHLLHFLSSVLFINIAIFEDKITTTCILTFVTIVLALESQLEKEYRLAFYGRFIQSGLKELLNDFGTKFISNKKVFRGKRIPILKIDMVGHTFSTYRMPYGVMELFQDLWISLLDQAVLGKVFLRKPEGDGFFFLYKEKTEEGACTSALQDAFRIFQTTLKEFDASLLDKLETKLQHEPDLNRHWKPWSDFYFKRAGAPFQERKTQIKIALVYGFIDEGLWGLASEGHYDIQGSLMAMAARLEKEANPGEVLITREFMQGLEAESPGFAKNLIVKWKTVPLKGIGDVEIGVISLSQPMQLTHVA